MEKFESRVGREKLQTNTGATPNQMGAARYLEEMELKKNRELRVQSDQKRIKEIRAEINSQSPKIELDYSKDGGMINKERRGAILAAEHAWSNEKPKSKPGTRPMIPPPPSKRSWFDRIIGRDQ